MQACNLKQLTQPCRKDTVIDTRNGTTRLEPDGWFLYRQEGKGMMLCFCELDTGTMTKDQLRAKFWRYETWAKSTRGQQFLCEIYTRHGALSPRPEFRILTVVCGRAPGSDQQRIEIVRDAAQSFPGTMARLRVASTSAFAESKHIGNVIFPPTRPVVLIKGVTNEPL